MSRSCHRCLCIIPWCLYTINDTPHGVPTKCCPNYAGAVGRRIGLISPLVIEVPLLFSLPAWMNCVIKCLYCSFISRQGLSFDFPPMFRDIPSPTTVQLARAEYRVQPHSTPVHSTGIGIKLSTQKHQSCPRQKSPIEGPRQITSFRWEEPALDKQKGTDRPAWVLHRVTLPPYKSRFLI